MRKLFIFVLAVAAMFATINPVYADSHGSSTTVEFVGKTESYELSVPAKLTPGESGTVTVSGQWEADSTLIVKAPKTVKLVNVTNPTEIKNLEITFTDIIQNGDNFADISISNPISVADLGIYFGTWRGTLEYTVELEEKSFMNSCLWYKIDGTTLKIRATETPGYTERVLHEDPAAAKNGWYANTTITKAIIEEDIYPTSCARFFDSCTYLTTIEGMEKFHTDYCVSFYCMFETCSRLESLDVSKWKTDNVTNMSCMFNQCSGLTALDTGDWNTSNVTNMKSMFQSCSKLEYVDVSRWNTGNVTDMSWMFNQCSALTTIATGKWDTSKVTDMKSMFRACSNLTDVNVSHFNTSNVTDMSNMFYYCNSGKLTSLDFSSFDTSKVTNMSYMFSYCSVKSLYLKTFNTSNVTNMNSMFERSGSIKSIYVGPGWDTSKATISDMFNYGGCRVTVLD